MVRLSVGIFMALALVAGDVAADDPPPFKDFSAKRVSPPKAGAKRLITVQIDPDAPASSDPAPQETAETASAVPRTARFDWFWQDVSPELEEAGPGRLDQALRALARAEQPVPVPRLQQMQTLAQTQGIEILKATIGTDVSPALVLAVMMVESAGRADAESGAGAQGLMQLMPDTAARFGVQDSFAPDQNIAGGVKYLDWLMDRFERDPVLVLAGYNAGEGAVKSHQGVPPFAETRDYVPKVLATFQVAQGLCVTPPQLVSDGCVFAALK
ncbi:lytic transglycosylase domain-containing protein [uncultured Tateyamaria sp.]|uniref:lytic transglycosylase domain-containing protein n=1 Tax=uncultured Tateyamaria sp. TaxID=455651 RepID=UPI0026349E60|nr:lytic transglycosylase domain-containing protein [uncultured Tateyamaria sp.]